MNRVLVTGGAGFIGAYSTACLLSHGFPVTVLDDFSTGRADSLPEGAAALRCIEGDILDYPLLVSALADCDAVLHLAGKVSVEASLADPVASCRVNVLGFLHILQAIRESGRRVRLVYASSAAVYGELSEPAQEALPLSGAFLSPYALQKAEMEYHAAQYQRLGVPSLGLRYFNVYGKGQRANSPYAGVIARFRAAHCAGRPLTVLGEGRQTRDFVHVQEVARANLLALKSSAEGVLNIAAGTSESVLDLITHLERVTGKRAAVQFQPARPGDILHSAASTAAACQQLGFQSSISLRQGLALWEEK